MTWLDLLKLLRFAAPIAGVSAPGFKPASRFRINGTCQLALENLALCLMVYVNRRDCREERLGVWMQRLLEEPFGLTFFNHLSQVHNAYIVRYVAHY